MEDARRARDNEVCAKRVVYRWKIDGIVRLLYDYFEDCMKLLW